MGEEERRIRQIMDRLNAHFEDRPMEFLTEREPWKLLLATILSAQCTDARVNQVTKVLYQHNIIRVWKTLPRQVRKK